jgi:sortase A
MKRALRCSEIVLIALGIGLLTVYGVFRMHAWFFQAYDSWSFEQALKKRSLEVHIPPSRTSSDLTGADLPDHRDWAPSRALAYENTLIRKPQSVLGRLLIPALNMNVMVLEGTDRWTLNRAVGHIENTALPGGSGNIGISAHRDGFFRNLGHLGKGDEISIVTLDGTYTYAVESTSIVGPTDVGVLSPSAKPILTLVTCFPFYFVGEAPQRFIVRARLVHQTS